MKLETQYLIKIRLAHYYGIIVAGTPDASHSKQFVFIIRYVSCQGREWKVHERFLKLTEFEKKNTRRNSRLSQKCFKR